jgi:hypothetical protein
MACFRPLTNLAYWSTTTEAQSIRQPVSFAPDCVALKVRRTVLSLICGSELSQLLVRGFFLSSDLGFDTRVRLRSR